MNKRNLAELYRLAIPFVVAIVSSLSVEVAIPKQYFNFTPYDVLETRFKKTVLLTGNLQLQSTSATTIDMDLAIEEYSEEIKRCTLTAAYGLILKPIPFRSMDDL
ncbi:hypothetical protein SSX86_032384 [Deinandra increscens subsp. villosa]|uniref:Uncharacterized protein n=1 Tax=Deinandra increscens subsp. villosa TaxID=3103831 RepID=A0AAP0C7D9_9ASTR